MINISKHIWFQDPNSFDPEAHFENDVMIPSAFLAFGQGPRNCVGMRFAWTIMKSLLSRVLLDYKILPGPEMPDKWEIDPQSPQGLPKNGVHVKLSPRA